MPHSGTNNSSGNTATGSRAGLWARIRFFLSWGAASALVVTILPRAVDVSWHGLVPVLVSVHWPAALGLSGLWLCGTSFDGVSFNHAVRSARLTARALADAVWQRASTDPLDEVDAGSSHPGH